MVTRTVTCHLEFSSLAVTMFHIAFDTRPSTIAPDTLDSHITIPLPWQRSPSGNTMHNVSYDASSIVLVVRRDDTSWHCWVEYHEKQTHLAPHPIVSVSWTWRWRCHYRPSHPSLHALFSWGSGHDDTLPYALCSAFFDSPHHGTKIEDIVSIVWVASICSLRHWTAVADHIHHKWYQQLDLFHPSLQTLLSLALLILWDCCKWWSQSFLFDINATGSACTYESTTRVICYLYFY